MKATMQSVLVLAVLAAVQAGCNWNYPTTSGYKVGNCGTGANAGGKGDSCVPVCADNYHGTASAQCYTSETCPETTQWEDLTGCTKNKCTLPATLTPYTLPTGCNADSNAQDFDACNGIACAADYRASVISFSACASDGTAFTLSGCAAEKCGAPAGGTTGYDVTNCDYTAAKIAPSACTVTCAAGYAGTPTVTCGATDGAFVFAGCVQQCQVPATADLETDVTAYSCTVGETTSTVNQAGYVDSGAVCRAECGNSKFYVGSATCSAGTWTGDTIAACIDAPTCAVPALAGDNTQYVCGGSNQDPAAAIAIDGTCVPTCTAPTLAVPATMTCTANHAAPGSAAWDLNVACVQPPKCTIPAVGAHHTKWTCTTDGTASDPAVGSEVALATTCVPDCATDYAAVNSPMTCAENSLPNVNGAVFSTTAICALSKCNIGAKASQNGNTQTVCGGTNKNDNDLVAVDTVCTPTCPAGKIAVDSTCSTPEGANSPTIAIACVDSCKDFNCGTCGELKANAETIKLADGCCNTKAGYAPTCADTKSTCSEGEMKTDVRAALPDPFTGFDDNNGKVAWDASACCESTDDESSAATKAVTLSLAVLAMLLALVL